MNKKFLTSFIAILMVVLCVFSMWVPQSEAATKYNYIANGEKDILGFKISGIVQKDDCDTIEIYITASKDIVEFSTYQDVLYNGTTYQSGNHTIEPCRDATFVYNVTSGQSLSPIIIYLTTIENTSCPLEIRYCNENGIVEKVGLTLSATFYGNQASELRDNKENSSGSLVQEDVIISRPNTPKPTEPKPTEPTEPKPTEPTEPKPTEPKPTEPKPTEPTQPTTPTEPTPSDPTESTQPTVPDTEVELPIVNPDATTPTNPNVPEEPDTTTPSEDTTQPDETRPVVPPESKPTDPNEGGGGLLDFINGIDTMFIYIAIGAVLFLLIVVVVIIIILSTKKKKKTEPVQQNVNTQPIYQENTYQPIPQQQEPVVAPPQEFIPQEVTPQAPMQQTCIMIDDDILDNSYGNSEPVQEETKIEEIDIPLFVEPEIPQTVTPPVVKDKFEQYLQVSIPTVELQKLKNELNTTGSVEDDYSNIVQ